MRLILAMAAVVGATIAVLPAHLDGQEPGLAAASRITVVRKNQTSPTLEELGQRAGDPSNAGAPQTVPVIITPRNSQWI